MVTTITPQHVYLWGYKQRYRQRWQNDLLAFTRRMFADYEPADHHRRIASALERIVDGESERLLIVMPPRHGKSTLASEHFPPWYLGKHPDHRIIACSHTQRLANTFSRRARNLMDRPEYPFSARVASDLSSVQTWDLQDQRGGYVAAGIGGPITGIGANVLVIDDPVKSAEEADSETFRETAWEWFTGTAVPRLEPGGSMIVIGTRWHQEDLIGRLIAAGGWTLLHLPAIDDETGEALWSERFPVEALERIRREVGSRNWEAQYQGRPSPAEGGTFKRDWWRFYRELPGNLTEQLQSWDMSFKETKAGSYVVGQVWARRGADRFLLDQVRFRGDFPTAVQAVRALSAKWPKANAKLVEDKANGPAIVSTLRGQVAGLIEVNPEGGKEARANAVAPQVEAGNVYLPDPSIAPWVHDFVEECAAFPTGAHNDQVDAMSQALLRMRDMAPAAAPVGIPQRSKWR